MKTFTEALNKALINNVKHNIKAVNAGGCGYFARYLSYYLKKEGIDYKIRANVYIDGLDHITIECKNRLFDSQGDVTEEERYNQTFSDRTLLDMVKYDNDWNPRFIQRNNMRGQIPDWKIINHLRVQIKKSVKEAVAEATYL